MKSTLLAILATFVILTSRICANDFGAETIEAEAEEEAKDPRFITKAAVFIFLNPVYKACRKEVPLLCADVYAWEGPCTYDLDMFPYERCYINNCLAFLALVDEDQQLSETCREQVVQMLEVSQFMRILEVGPQNWLERLASMEVIANIFAFAFFSSPFAAMISLSLLAAMPVLCYVDCRNTHAHRKRRAGLFLGIYASPELKTLVENLTEEPFDPTPFKFYWDIQRQQQQFRKQRNHINVLRAIYSDPETKTTVQNGIPGNLHLGHTPPLSDGDLRQLFNKPLSRMSLKYWLRWLNVFLFCVMVFCQEVLPVWMYTLVWFYVAVRSSLWACFRACCTEDGIGTHSTCCQCGTTSKCRAAERKKTDDPTCPLCQDTGVCSLDCEDCAQRLAKRFTILNIPLAEEPLVQAGPPAHRPPPADPPPRRNLFGRSKVMARGAMF